MRLIDADGISVAKFVGEYADSSQSETAYRKGWNDAIDAIKKLSLTVQPKNEGLEPEIRTVHEHMISLFTCPFCGFDVDEEYNFCPNCGVELEHERD